MRLMTALGLLVSLAGGFYTYSSQIQQMAKVTGASSPSDIIDAVAVKSDLLAMAGAERQQFALEGRYLSFEALRARGVDMPDHRGQYVFRVDVKPTDFLITATYVPKDDETETRVKAPFTVGPSMVVHQDQAEDEAEGAAVAAATEDEEP